MSFTKIEKKSVVKLPDIVPLEEIEDVFYNQFYKKSYFKESNFALKNYEYDKQIAIDIVSTFFPKKLKRLV